MGGVGKPSKKSGAPAQKGPGRQHASAAPAASQTLIVPKGYVQVRESLAAGAPLVFVSGNAGTGKTTLIRHLNGLLKPSSGSVEVDGFGTVDSPRDVLQRVGMVFQSPDDQLFSPTVYDDVAYGPLYQGLPLAEVDQRVEEALGVVGMEGYARRISHHLSTGEKKRIAIATVLSMRPEVLVLDEPTAGLDPRARRSLINLLGRLPLTTLVSTHDMYLVRDLFPRMVVMDEGRIIADGATESILYDKSLLEAHGLESPR